jgi:hypothetical protein
MGQTYEELLAQGAKPKALTFEELVAQGAKPIEPSHDIPVGVRAPEKTVGDRLRQAAGIGLNATSNAVDAATLGYYRKVRDAIGGAISPGAVAQAQGQEHEAESSPVGQFVGGLGTGAGYLAGGLPSMAAKAAERGVAAAGINARPIAGALTGALTGGAVAGGEAAVGGADLADVGRSAGTGALIGGALGGTAGTIAATGSKTADYLAANKHRKLIDQYGGKVSLTSPGKGGAFEDPLIAGGIDAKGNVTDAGIGSTARTAARQVRQGLNDEHRAAGGIYASDTAKLRASGALEGHHDISILADEAKAMADDAESYTNATREKVKAEILPILEKYAREDGSYSAPADSVNKIRQKIAKLAKYDTPTGVVKDKDIAQLARTAKGLVDETAFSAPNAAYAERMDTLKEAHRGLNIQGKSRAHTDPNDMAAEKTLTDLITRRGQNTVTAGKYETPELASVVEGRPELALPLDSAALLRARGAMQFIGGGKHGGLIERVKHPIGALMQAAEPIGQRIVRPIADAAASVSPPRNANPLLRASEEKRKREARNSNILSGAGN